MADQIFNVFVIHHTWNDDNAGSLSIHRTLDGTKAHAKSLVEENYEGLDDPDEIEAHVDPLLSFLDAVTSGDDLPLHLDMGDCCLQISMEPINP